MGMYDIDTSYTISKHPEIKCTNTGDKMYKLNIVPDDLSVYTWGSKNFQKKNVFHISDLNAPYKIDKIGGDTNAGTPICLCLPGTTSTSGYSISIIDKKKTTDCIAYDSENLTNVALVRYVKEYYYKEYVLLIKVAAVTSNTITTRPKFYDLDTYYNTDAHVTHPVIRCVTITPYYRSDTTKNREFFSMYPSINTIAEAKYTAYKTDYLYKWFNTCPISSLFGGDVALTNDTSIMNPIFNVAKNTSKPLINTIMTKSENLGFVAEQSGRIYFAPDLTNLTKDQIMTECAKLGFCFVTSTANAQTKKYGESGFYVPEIKGGYTTGEYFDGTEAKDLPQNSWSSPTASYDNSEYDPKKPIDPNDYTDKIDLNKPKLTTTGIFNRTFGMNATNIRSLADYLWNADETVFNEIIKGLSLMCVNPIDGLIDLRLYPFDVVSKTSGGASKNIVVGRTDTKVNGIEINDYNAVLDLGSCSFFPYFGNFLDYEPYTTGQLYIPYVGIVPISTAVFMGQTISCKMVVDITTGSCTAIVFCNGIPLIYKNGNIGVEIPMTATNSAQYAARIMSGLTSAATDLTLGAATGNPMQIASSVGGITDAAMASNNTIYNTAGSSSPACGLWQPQNCYFIINRPVPIVPDSYGHNVGYACNYQANLSSLSGFTCCYNTDINTLYATEEEKDEIVRLLGQGVYL